MKQAILITAYKNLHHLEEIINFFDNDFNIYIHFDKKSKISRSDVDHLKQMDRVRFISWKYKVNWGGLNHLKSILYLSEKALKDQENYFFHLISGHDFPIKGLAEFKEYFQKNRTTEYLGYFNVPRPGWADNGGMERLEYYNFYDLFDAKDIKQNSIIRRLFRLQKHLGWKRELSAKIPPLYGGSTWWSLSRDCLKYVVEYNRKNRFLLKRFRYTLCSEEFYFPTVVMNSPFVKKVENRNLRYIDWVARNGNNPAILDDSDWEKLISSDDFFARKFEYPTSQSILDKIKMHLNSRNELSSLNK